MGGVDLRVAGFFNGARMPHNKQLQRTVTRRRGDGASAPFHYAHAPRATRQCAAAQPRRYTARTA